MRKISLIAILALLIAGCGKDLTFRSNREMDGLKGPVKSYTLTNYAMGADGEVAREKVVKNFTEQGFISSSRTENLLRNRSIEVSYEFGSDGLPTKSTRLDSQTGEETHMEMSYDFESATSTIQQFDSEGGQLFHLNRQYQNGYYKVDKVTDANGELMQEVHYFRNEEGLISREETYMGGRQEPVSVARFEYDDKGVMTTSNQTGYNGKEISYNFTYEWDSQGNWTSRTISRDGRVDSRDQRELTYY